MQCSNILKSVIIITLFPCLVYVQLLLSREIDILPFKVLILSVSVVLTSLLVIVTNKPRKTIFRFKSGYCKGISNSNNISLFQAFQRWLALIKKA